jgi:KaiC/GvpD/RAD55 family RecA-like ATPase
MHMIYKTLKREWITTLMTVSKLESGDFIGGGIEEFVADGIFQLENYVTKNMELRTRFIIRKMRGTDHSRKFHTVAFTPSGIEILSFSE